METTFNGATAFRQWKQSRAAVTPAVPASLQWGHRLSAVETGSVMSALAIITSLQWGHRLSAVETRVGSVILISICPASMGPPPFGSGNIPNPCGPLFVPLASMGPPPFGSGNPPVVDGRRRKERVASMGPPPFGSGNVHILLLDVRAFTVLQWGHRLSAVETRIAGVVLRVRRKASMGPPPFGSGNRYLCSDSDFNPWDYATSAANTSGTRRRFISA